MGCDGDWNSTLDDVTAETRDADGDVGGNVHLSLRDVTDPKLQEVSRTGEKMVQV